MQSCCHLQIDLNIIKDNYQQLRQLTNAEVAAVVKADSYGLGATKVAKTLQQEGCKHFFVAQVKEAIDLRLAIKTRPIYVLNGIAAGEEEYFYQYNLTPIINHLGQLAVWQQFAKLVNKKLPAILHADTGLHRYAMMEEELLKLISDREHLASHIQFKFLMSHLACSDDDDPYNHFQLKNFLEYQLMLGSMPGTFANSAGIFLGPNYHFDLVRPGAALYGLQLNEKMLSLKNPIKLTSKILQIKELPAGSKLGYNLTFQAEQPTKIATIPVGYADGMLRSLSNNGACYIHGHKAAVVGRVSMDLINLDVSNVPETLLYPGQEVELLGPHQTPNDLAKAADTSGYEILTSLSNRYERIYHAAVRIKKVDKENYKVA